jgi:Zn-dependent peptidase ImmA (M78 family)
MSFKHYLKESENSYKEEINKTLKKLPKKHAALIKSFKYEFQGTNTLKNDGEHVGLIDTKKKKIIIASPWNYGREHTLLHEIGHLVYATLNNETKKKWAGITKNTKMEREDRQNPEELFCHAYATCYAKNKIDKFNHPTWCKFIEDLK